MGKGKSRSRQGRRGVLVWLTAGPQSLSPELQSGEMGNLFGEFIAVEHYGLTKAPRGADGYDARTPDGKTVQVKANHAASQIGFRGQADLMLVLKIDITGEWEEVYYGPFEPL